MIEDQWVAVVDDSSSWLIFGNILYGSHGETRVCQQAVYILLPSDTESLVLQLTFYGGCHAVCQIYQHHQIHSD